MTSEPSPYLIPEPALISFSGGRTSGYMLWHILQAYGGKLPKDIRVAFMNTGKEREETLEFVRECGERWGVEIVWLEYTADRVPDGTLAHSFQTVNFDFAARRGEPFAALIAARSFLPNAVMRFCTQELKVRVAKKWMIAQGYEHWAVAIGIRADEPGRMGRGGDDKERFTKVYPLADAGACVEDVMAFWAAQPFDLHLRQDEGNCDLCFLKGRKKLKRLILERPESADWWIAQESSLQSRAASPSLAKFNKDRSFAELRDQVFSLPLLEECGVSDEIEDCHCTD